MKKLLIVLSVVAAFFTITAFITPDKANTLPGPDNSCKLVGNCTVTLINEGNGKYHAEATNKNTYNVTVDWTAIGYDSYGKERRVQSGVLAVDKYASSQYGTARSSTFQTNCEDVGLGSVYVKKCD